MRRLVPWMLLCTLLISACGGEDGGPSTTVEDDEPVGAASPELAVSELFRLLNRPDPGNLLGLTDADQMIVVALVEGVEVEDALLLETTGVDAVTRSFWDGFRSSLRDVLGSDVIEMRVGQVELETVAGAEFARVGVSFPLDGSTRVFYVVRQDDLWTIDVIATFAPALAPKLPGVADAVRRAPESGDLPAILRGLEPSLLVVQTTDDLDPGINQVIVAALEAVRR